MCLFIYLFISFIILFIYLINYFCFYFQLSSQKVKIFRCSFVFEINVVNGYGYGQYVSAFKTRTQTMLSISCARTV